MSLFFNRGLGDTPAQLVPPRSRWGTPGAVTPESALRHSAVWACLRLRANLVSSMPVDYYRKVGPVEALEQTKPPVLTKPGALYLGGRRARMDEWLYASQMDLDRYGNSFGLITEWDGQARPARIDLVDAGTVTVRIKSGEITYRIGGKVYDPVEVWHERQNVVAGLPVGLSPIAFAAMSIGQYLSAQKFAADWFATSAIPKSQLKNTGATMTNAQSSEAKAHFTEQLTDGGMIVLGSDWEWSMVEVPATTAQFIEAQQFSVADVCRFLDVPGDLIDAAQAGSSITYANLTQRNLQLLIMHLGPAVKRREDALSELSAAPRFVKLNTDALLRMDPAARDLMLTQQVASKRRTITEARAVDNLPPYTPEQEDEIARLSASRSEPTKPIDDGKATS